MSPHDTPSDDRTQRISVNGPVLALIARELEALVGAMQFAIAEGGLSSNQAAQAEYGRFLIRNGPILLAFLRMNGVQKLGCLHLDASGVMDHKALIRDVVVLFSGFVIGAYKEHELDSLLETFGTDVRAIVARMVEQRDANLPRM